MNETKMNKTKMSETKWTPGPWSFFRPSEARQMTKPFDSHRAFRIFSTAPSNKPGCQCIGALVPGHLNDPPPSEADARLMSRAPELYAELERLVLRCDGDEGVRADGTNIDTLSAHAALAAARGESL